MKKDKAFYSMLAFITTCLIVLSLFASGITVFADGTFNVIEHYEIDSYLTDSDFPDLNHFNFLATNYSSTNPDTMITNGLNISDNINDYPYFNEYYVWFNGEIVNCSTDSFLVVDSTKTGSRLYFKVDNVSNNIFKFTKANFGGSTNVWDIDTSNDSRCVTVDGDMYFMWGGYSTLYTIFNANIPIYEVPDIETTLTSRPTENINPNYNSNDESVNIRDHRNFNPALMFINTNTNYGGDGLVTSLGYDKWQRENLDRYKITWDYSLDFTVSSTSDSYNQHFVKNGYSQTLDNIPTGRFAMSLPEIFITMYDGNTNCWNTIKDISMKTIKNDTSFGVSGGVNIGVANFELNANTPLTLDKSIGITEFKFYVTASIVADDNIDCGTFGYTYDFLDGTYTNTTNFKDQEEVNNTISQYNHDNNLSSGDSGYLDISDYQSTMPASNNYPAVSGGSVSQGGNASAQGGIAYGSNVNNSVIVNTQNPKEVVNYIKGELLPSGDSVGYVEKLDDAVEGNSFITLMSNTFSFVPASVWSDLGFYFEIFLGILVSFFVLRLILDLL